MYCSAKTRLSLQKGYGGSIPLFSAKIENKIEKEVKKMLFLDKPYCFSEKDFEAGEQFAKDVLKKYKENKENISVIGNMDDVITCFFDIFEDLSKCETLNSLQVAGILGEIIITAVNCVSSANAVTNDPNKRFFTLNEISELEKFLDSKVNQGNPIG